MNARTALAAAAMLGGLPPLPRGPRRDRFAYQTPEQRDAAKARAEAKRARRRERNRRVGAHNAARHAWRTGAADFFDSLDELLRWVDAQLVTLEHAA